MVSARTQRFCQAGNAGSTSPLRLDRQGDTIRLCFQTPNNTITRALIRELRRVLGEHAQDPGARVLVLRGGGDRIFCPGLDLAEVAALDRPRMRDFMTDFCALYLELFAHPKPTLAELNGHALAGGCILANSCDFRLSGNHCSIGFTGLNRYFPIPAGCQKILRFRVGTRLAARLTYRVQKLSADTAFREGWLDWIGPGKDLSDEVTRWTHDLAALSTQSFQISKQNLQGELQKEIAALDAGRLDSFLDCWFDPDTQKQIQQALDRLKTS